MNAFDILKLKINNYSLNSIKKIISKESSYYKRDVMQNLIDNIIPSEYITEELIKYAFNECNIYVTAKSPEKIRNNPYCIKRCIDLFNSGEYINYMDEEYITDELIEYALKNFYVIKKNSPKKIKYSKKYLLFLLNNYCCLDNSIAFLRFYPTEEIKDEHIKQIVSKCGVYFLDKTNITIFNKRIVLYFMKYVNYISDLDYIFKRCDPSILTTDLLILAADKGYWPSFYVPDVVRRNKELLIYLLKNKSMNSSNISNFIDIEVDDELIDILVKKDYLFNKDTPNYLKNNYIFIKKLLENTTNINNINNIITYCNQNILDDYLIDIALKKGYSGSDIYSKKIMNNYDYVYRFMSNTGNWDIINKIDQKLIDDKLKLLALKNGYRFSEYSPGVLKDDYEFIKKTIENDVPVAYYGYSNHTLCFCNKDIIDDNLITLAIEHGFYISFCHNNINDDIPNNLKYISMMIDKYCGSKEDNSLIIDEMLKKIKIKNLSKEQIRKIINIYPSFIINYFCLNENVSYISNIFKCDYHFSKNPYKKIINDIFGSPISYLLINHPILRKDVVEKLGIENVIRIIKYGLLGCEYFPLQPIIENNELDCLLSLYTTLTENEIFNIDILSFVKCTIFFYEYYDVVKEVISNNKLDEYSEKLKLLSENKYRFENINSIDKLNNIEEYIYEYNEEICNSDDMYCIKNSIFLILVNNTYEEINKLFEIVDVYKIDELLKNESLSKYYNLLEYYRILISFIKEIKDMTYVEELKNILSIINNDLLFNRNNYKITSDSFKDITKVFKRIYAKEAQSKLTKISNRESTDTFTIYDDKYRTRKQSINGEVIDKKEVRYIEISEEAYFFQHVMNAFGTGGKLYDFKRRRGVGKSYICLSATSNKKIAKLNRRIKDIDHVTLLFNDIKSSSLVFMSPHDINSRGNLNNLSIVASESCFDTLDNIISQTKDFNEYVVYREDNNGNIIYPCGVLVSGDTPKKAEINAAAYLGIPLIKLLPIKKSINPLIMDYDERIINNDNVELLNHIMKKVKRK